MDIEDYKKAMSNYFLGNLKKGSKFDRAFAKILEDFSSYDKNGHSSFFGGKNIDFTVNNVKYRVIATYYNEISALEIRFVNIDRYSYNITGDANLHAMRVYSNVAHSVQDILTEIKNGTNGFVPLHIYFAGDNKEPKKVKLYNKFCNYKPVVNMLNEFKYVRDDIYAKNILEFVKHQENDKKDNYVIFCFTLK